MTFEVKNGSFGYPNGRKVLDRISFRVKKGEMLAILGPNGAGKTTLLRCMMGFLQWHEGESLLDGRNIASMNQRELFSKVAYVPQAKGAVMSASVKDMVLLGRSSRYSIFGKPGEKDRQIVAATLEKLGLSHLAECSCAELSGGELQMVLIARAIASEPQIIILDEPETDLDFNNQLIVLKTLHALTEQGISCIFNTHYPVHALRHADKALLLDKKGGVCFGDAYEVITQENMRSAFGVETAIGQVETPTNQYFDIIAIDTIPEETTQESEAGPMTQTANTENTRLAILGIIIENRDSADRVNAMLHEYGEYIIGRMGMPYPARSVNIISVIMDAPETAISNLSGKLGQLQGVSAKVTYSKR